MLYTDDWLFLHIPKTGGYNLKQNALQQTSAKYPDIDLGYFNVAQHNPLWYWQDYVKDKWIFTIVRNPFVRIASLYAYCLRYQIIKNMTFEQFLKIDNIDIENVEWTVSTKMLDFIDNQNPNNEVNVFKLEEDLTPLENRLGFTFTDTKYNNDVIYNLEEIYTKDTIEMVKEMFFDDFIFFGYDLNLTQ